MARKQRRVQLCCTVQKELAKSEIQSPMTTHYNERYLWLKYTDDPWMSLSTVKISTTMLRFLM